MLLKLTRALRAENFVDAPLIIELRVRLRLNKFIRGINPSLVENAFLKISINVRFRSIYILCIDFLLIHFLFPSNIEIYIDLNPPLSIFLTRGRNHKIKIRNKTSRFLRLRFIVFGHGVNDVRGCDVRRTSSCTRRRVRMRAYRNHVLHPSEAKTMSRTLSRDVAFTSRNRYENIFREYSEIAIY